MPDPLPRTDTMDGLHELRVDIMCGKEDPGARGRLARRLEAVMALLEEWEEHDARFRSSGGALYRAAALRAALTGETP